MPPLYAAIYGGVTRLLIGFGIAMFQDMTWADTLFRLLVLATGGAILGGLMGWLDSGLTAMKKGHEVHKQTTDPS